ncbi:MAG: endonuclease/exonuclease/phosphatase family protein, partial [Deltaproteobacteria bacterium]|nr:endonuclease/exonuclease/phosphatase family protein [Deltaproteobacteria bacterium]
RRSAVLMRWSAIAVMVLLVGCGVPNLDVEWMTADQIEGALAVEIDALPAEPRAVDGPLRVVSFNVEYGAETEAIAQALQRGAVADADVILVQEIEAYPGENGSRTARIADLLGMAYVYAPARKEGEGTHGLAVLSRSDIRNVRVMTLPDFQTVVRDRRRIALAVEVEGIDVVSIHLDLQLGAGERVQQLLAATSGLGEQAIIGGDLNTNPYAWIDVVPVVPIGAVSELEVPALVDDAMADAGFPANTAGSGPTHQSPAGELRLDSVYARGFEVDDAGVSRDSELSDHWPVWVQLRPL